MKHKIKITDITEENIDRIQVFLENNSDTSLFLSSNLSMYGPRLGDSMNSGNFKCIETDNMICGVFCLTRRGNLIAETGGRLNLADDIVDACANEPIMIRGVVGEWELSNAIWNILLQFDNFIEHSRSKQVLYRLDLSQEQILKSSFNNIRQLRPNDFEQWNRLNSASMQEQGMPIQGSLEEQRANYEESARSGYWWGYLENGNLFATVALNALYKQTGQVGGVYTNPSWRRCGLSRSVMKVMIRDCMQIHHLRKLILFTGENNTPARRLYESLGFVQIGHYALLFGSISANKP